MIYFALLPGGSIKIGSAERVNIRIKALQIHYGLSLKLLAVMPGGMKEEREIHSRFVRHRIGNTEQFRPATDLMTFIDEIPLIDIDPNTVEAVPGHKLNTGLRPANYRFSTKTIDQITAICKATHGLSRTRVMTLAIERMYAEVCGSTPLSVETADQRPNHADFTPELPFDRRDPRTN